MSAMPGPAAVEFCPIRMSCTVSVDGAAPRSGWTVLVAPTAVHADVGFAPGEAALFEPGDEATLTLATATAAPLSLRGRLRWSSTAGDGAHRLAFGGVQAEPASAARWAALVEDYKPAVLLVDRDGPDRTVVEQALSPRYRVVVCGSAAEALAALEREEFAVLLTEQRLPDQDGPTFLTLVSRRHPRSQTVRLMMSAFTRADEVQDLINLGRLFHYLRKPAIATELSETVDRAARTYAMAVENQRLALELQQANRQLRSENADLRRRLRSAETSEPLVGQSPSFRRALEDLGRLRDSDAPVHIAGETGTGKELVARELHRGSARARRPFVAQNCAALPDTLLQSTLFGHCRGAFTGADRNQPGVFQAADGGTLFLDEVSELSLQAQAALLRAVQTGEVTPVGTPRQLRVDVRIVSATHKDLRAEVRAGRFREDLFFRLVVMQVSMPPLRERPADIALLADHFLRVFSDRAGKRWIALEDATVRALELYAWPGNVRELRNEMERVVVLAQPGVPASTTLLSPHVRGEAMVPAVPCERVDAVPSASPIPPYDDAVRAFERELVGRALESNGGVISRAADALGMERSRLSKLRQRLGV